MRGISILLAGLALLIAAVVALGLLKSEARTKVRATPTFQEPPAQAADASPLTPPPAVVERSEPEPTGDDDVAAAETHTTTAESAERHKLPPGRVELFEHATHDPAFPGAHWEVDAGLTNAGWAFPSDEASAVEVPHGLQATLFEHEDGEGHRVMLGPGVHNLAPYGLNDSVSSIRVTRFGQDVDSPVGPEHAVELYEHRTSDLAQRGETWTLALPEGRDERLFTSAASDFRAFAVSCAWVPPGYELTLFQQPDGRGLAMVLGPGYHELDLVGFNDRAASARVRRIR